MEKKDFINQWEEVMEMSNGKSADEIRSLFKDRIINEVEMGEGLDHDLIDVNYKNIRVTFILKNGNAKLHYFLEAYDNDRNFVSVINVRKP